MERLVNLSRSTEAPGGVISKLTAMHVCIVLPVQVEGSVVFGFVDIQEQLRSQILQHAILQHLVHKDRRKRQVRERERGGRHR